MSKHLATAISYQHHIRPEDIMFISVNTSNIKTLKPGDDGFLIHDNIAVAPRAAFEISKDCPYEYRLLLQQCIDEKWISPIANVTNEEYTWNTLKGNV